MEGKFVESRSNFSFHMDGESSVDAELLSSTISEMARLTKQAALIENPDAYVRLKISAFKNGSFEVIFSTICEAGNTLSPYIQFASAVTSIIVGYFEIKKHLKGKNPKSVRREGSAVRIENCEGQTIISNDSSSNIINNIHIDNMVTNIIQYTQSNDPNHGFTISNDEHKVSCTPDDLKYMSNPLPIQEKHSNITSCSTVHLAIKKPDLLGFSKWAFLLNGRGIEASISDTDWLSKVHNGDIVIRAHDNIYALLETTIEVDESNVPIENSTRYNVLEIYRLYLSDSENQQTHL